jgi:hypothetical protein
MLFSMPILDRRRFLLTAAAAATSLRALAQAIPVKPATLKFEAAKPGAIVPTNFVGLSYETQQLSDPTFFSPKNTGLIEQFRALAPTGVLRLGGNTSDVGWWKPTATSKQPPLPANVVVQKPLPDQRPFQELAYPITPLAVTNLRAFLDATNWTCIYGINLGTNTPARAAEEAAFVAKTLGAKLEFFQLGNEPDIFYNRFREKAAWNADAYFDEWIAQANAIRAVVFGARFGLSDNSGNPAWYAKVIGRLLAMPAPTCPCEINPHAACSCATGPNTPPTRPHVASLTHHYYFTGPPSNPNATIDNLLRPNPRVLTLAHNITEAAAHLSAGEHIPVPYRMTEGNTCYRGGKPGFSDVFAAALWSADYFLQLASLGYSGVNLHGGSGKMVADSLGGTLPGELLMPDPHVPHARPFYTPIDVEGGKYTAEPVSFGMRFAASFAGATMHAVDFTTTLNATAYAAILASGQPIVAIINKDAAPLPLDLPGYALALTLSAPSVTSTRVSLSEPTANREVSTVPPYTAVLLRSTRP